MKRIVCRRSCILQARFQQAYSSGNRLVQIRLHSHDHDHDKEGEVTEIVNINWQNRDGSVTSTKAKAGTNLLSLARKYDIELEGACEGVCACSTCHVILEDAVFDAQPDPTEDEEDMLGELQSNIVLTVASIHAPSTQQVLLNETSSFWDAYSCYC